MTQPKMPTALMSDSEILEKFYLLNTTLGLTKTRLGYIACGQANIITMIERGRGIHGKTRKQLTDLLRYIEAAHTDPMTPEMKARLDAMGVKIPEPPDDEIEA